MSGDVEKLKRWIGKAPSIGEPPTPADARGSTGREDTTVQLNLKVPRELRRRLKQLSVNEDRSMVAILRDMLDQYEGRTSTK